MDRKFYVKNYLTGTGFTFEKSAQFVHCLLSLEKFYGENVHWAFVEIVNNVPVSWGHSENLSTADWTDFCVKNL